MHSSPTAPARRSAVSQALARDRVGVPSVWSFLMSGIAPLTVAAGVITSAYATTGLTGIPFAFLAVAVVLALFVPGYVAMTRHITNAGAFSAFIARGLGKPLGVAAALMALLASHIGAATPFQAWARRNIDNAAAGSRWRHRLHRGAAAQHATDEVHVDLLADRRNRGLAQRRESEAASDMDRGPQRRTAGISARHRRLVGEAAGHDQRHLLVIAQTKALRLRLVVNRARGRSRRPRSTPRQLRCQAPRRRR